MSTLVATVTPIEDSPLEAPRMRAWCSTEASDEHPYRGFAARSAQNASVVPWGTILLVQNAHFGHAGWLAGWCLTETYDEHLYRGFAAPSAQNASVVLNRSIRRAPLSKIRRSKRPECERGVQPIHPTGTPIEDSPLQALRMRAWCSTAASDEHPYRGFAARSAQNASVVPKRSM